MTDARVALGRAAATLAALRPAAPSPLDADFADAQHALDRTINSAARQLRTWRQRYGREKRKRDAEIRDIKSYASTTRTQLNRYIALRSKLDDWLGALKRKRALLRRAERFLTNARNQRQQIDRHQQPHPRHPRTVRTGRDDRSLVCV